MKHYYPHGPVEEVRLVQRELISTGEEILSRARLVGQVLTKKIRETAQNQQGHNRDAAQPGSSSDRR